MSYDVKAFALELKELHEDGTFEGYAAVFGNLDRGGDVIEKGAFKRTIGHKNGAMPVLWQHDTSSPIGVGLEMREDDHGLWVKAKLALTTVKGREAYDLLKMGAIKGLSIGYRVVRDAVEVGRRILKEIELFEYSVVTIPMNPITEVRAVKGALTIDKDKTYVLACDWILNDEGKQNMVTAFKESTGANCVVLGKGVQIYGNQFHGETKAGRMLSAKTRESMMQAIREIQALLDADAASATSESGKSHSQEVETKGTGDSDDFHSLQSAFSSLLENMRAA